MKRKKVYHRWPVLVCAMSYHNEGALLEFFAPERHKMEIYAVDGGSRYDIEWSPVYEAFHKYPGTERVGWKGWCRHLIKDQWVMGGRKEDVTDGANEVKRGLLSSLVAMSGETSMEEKRVIDVREYYVL